MIGRASNDPDSRAASVTRVGVARMLETRSVTSGGHLRRRGLVVWITFARAGAVAVLIVGITRGFGAVAVPILGMARGFGAVAVLIARTKRLVGRFVSVVRTECP